MKQYQPINLISGDWGRIEFKTLDLIVPSDRMLLDLIRTPTLDYYFICNILIQYAPPNLDRLQAILDRNNPDTLWQEITQEIADSSFDEKLYTMVSLHSHRLTCQPSNAKSQSKSQAVLKKFSNELVLMIESELEPSKLDEICVIFCAKAGIDYRVVRYHEAVVAYCLRILPLPLNYVRSVDNEGALAIFIAESLPLIKSSGEVPRHPDPKLGAYQSRKVEAERRSAAIFVEYRQSRFFLDQFARLIGLEHPEVYQERLFMNYSTVTNNRNYRRSKGSRQKDLLLCRCEFCYLFSTIERKRGVDPAWHCHRKTCKGEYRDWINHLNTLSKKDICLETLYKQGL